ncbi:MAG TPA: hypothetical protein ENK85_01770 [Saprospiraceae bacterium]|nr:hypothetical protein [Saprospiraceae bacterium]
MTFTKLEKIWSYIWPALLFKGKEVEGKPLELHLSKGRLLLQVEDAIYSYDDLYHVFKKAFEMVDLPASGAKSLILGYGLGSIPYILERHHQRIYPFTGVEYDHTIISLAQKYATPRLTSPVGLLHVDALVFMDRNRQQYDFICVDIFHGGRVPAFAKETDFLEQLSDSLTPKGLLLFNYMKTDEADFTTFYQRFLDVFPEGQYLDLGSNYVLVNRPKKGSNIQK